MASKRIREAGFTLIELLVVIGIISILASIAIMQYQNYRVQAYDTAAKSDLKNAMAALENYFVENSDYPADKDDLLVNGLNLSKKVCFTKYDLKTFDGDQPTVHMHVWNSGSPNRWHANYPEEAGQLEIRTEEPCL